MTLTEVTLNKVNSTKVTLIVVTFLKVAFIKVILIKVTLIKVTLIEVPLIEIILTKVTLIKMTLTEVTVHMYKLSPFLTFPYHCSSSQRNPVDISCISVISVMATKFTIIRGTSAWNKSRASSIRAAKFSGA